MTQGSTTALGLSLRADERDGILYLQGVMNEDSDLSPLLPLPAPLSLNFREVQRFNSIGIRNFLRFLQQWGPKPMVYIDCPVELINQITMIPSLLGMPKPITKIETLFVPYGCTSCDHEEETLYPMGDFAGIVDGADAPEKTCPKCGQPMEVASDTFFAFLEG